MHNQHAFAEGVAALEQKVKRFIEAFKSKLISMSFFLFFAPSFSKAENVTQVKENCPAACGLCTPTNCKDNEKYIDPFGQTCANWTGYECGQASEQFGISKLEETLLLKNCEFCKMCPWVCSLFGPPRHGSIKYCESSLYLSQKKKTSRQDISPLVLVLVLVLLLRRILTEMRLIPPVVRRCSCHLKVESRASFAGTGVMIPANFHSWQTARDTPGVFMTKLTPRNGAKRRKSPVITTPQKSRHGRFAFQMELRASSRSSLTKHRLTRASWTQPRTPHGARQS